MVIICAGTEYLSIHRTKKIARYFGAVGIGLCLVLLVEYIPRNPFDATNFWSYSNSLPHVYSTIKSSSSLNVLAEYPMREQPYYRGSLYLTAQHVYNKPTINGYMPTSSSAYERMAINDLTNPQTLPVLHYLGADTLLVWNTKKDSWKPTIDGTLKFIETNTYSSQFGKDEVLNLYYIQNSLPERRYEAVIENNYRPENEAQLTHIKVPIQPGISIAAFDLCSVTLRTNCVSDKEPQYYLADFYNQSDTPIDLTLKAFDSSSTQHIGLKPGKNTLRIEMRSSRYIIDFDQKFTNKVSIMNQEIVK